MRPSRRRRLDGQSPGLPNQNEAGFIGETAASSALTAPHHPKSRILQQLMTSPPDPLTFCPKKLPLPPSPIPVGSNGRRGRKRAQF